MTDKPAFSVARIVPLLLLAFERLTASTVLHFGSVAPLLPGFVLLLRLGGTPFILRKALPLAAGEEPFPG